MNWKTWMPVAVAVVLGIVAVKVGKDMIAHGGSGQAGLTTAKAVILTADVPAGSAIKESDLTVGKLSAGAVPNGTFTDMHDLIGRVPQVNLVRGQTVLENLLMPTGTMPGLPSLIPDGMRAVTVDVDEIRGVAGMLQPGCHVDLVATIGGEGGISTARNIVEDLTILAVGRRYSNSQPEPDPAQGMARAITLLATPHQAEIIDLASHMANPRLVLRGSRDNAKVNVAGVTVAELRGKKIETQAYAAALSSVIGANKTATTDPSAAAQPAEPQVYDVEVLRNGQETHVKLPLIVAPVPSGTVVESATPIEPGGNNQTAPRNPPATQPTAEGTTGAATQPAAVLTPPAATQPAAVLTPAATQPDNSQAAAPATQQSSNAVIRDAGLDQRNAIPNGKN